MYITQQSYYYGHINNYDDDMYVCICRLTRLSLSRTKLTDEGMMYLQGINNNNNYYV